MDSTLPRIVGGDKEQGCWVFGGLPEHKATQTQGFGVSRFDGNRLLIIVADEAVLTDEIWHL
jgi:hypothetical protein